jgi:hypothetical protein
MFYRIGTWILLTGKTRSSVYSGVPSTHSHIRRGQKYLTSDCGQHSSLLSTGFDPPSKYSLSLSLYFWSINYTNKSFRGMDDSTPFWQTHFINRHLANAMQPHHFVWHYLVDRSLLGCHPKCMSSKCFLTKRLGADLASRGGHSNWGWKWEKMMGVSQVSSCWTNFLTNLEDCKSFHCFWINKLLLLEHFINWTLKALPS